MKTISSLFLPFQAFPWGKVLSVSEADEGNHHGNCRGKTFNAIIPLISRLRRQLLPGEAFYLLMSGGIL